MKMRTSVFLTSALVISLSSVTFSYEKMDLETNALVIQKLERALPLSKDETVKYKIVLLRLGDAYSEKARLLFMDETEKGKTHQDKTKATRNTAINYYKKSLKHLSSRQEKVKVYYQIAHLSQMNGLLASAKRYFSKVVKTQTTGRLPSLAFTALGDMSYDRKHFKSALIYYNNALKTKNPPREGYLVHRKAWTHYALAQNRKAVRLLEIVLKTPKLLSDKSGRIDEIFLKEVATDFALFSAKLPITSSVVKKVVDLTPRRNLQEVLFTFSEETERLGKHRATLLVLNAIRDNIELNTKEEGELTTRYALLAFNLNDRKTARNEFSKALKLWGKADCDKSSCGNFKTELRNLLVHWQKSDKLRPNLSLLEAFEAYLTTFPNDSELYLHAGVIASQIKQYNRALTLHEKGVKNTEEQRLKEANLVALLENAENIKSSKSKIDAYDFYLEHGRNPKDRENVLFLKASALFGLKKFDKSNEIFKSLLASKHLKDNERITSANKYLEGLTKLNDHDKVYSESHRLIKRFPTEKKAYAAINRTAALKLSRDVINSKDREQDTLLKAQKRLEKANTFNASESEKLKLSKAALLLSIMRKDLQDTSRIAKNILDNRKLSRSDRDQILLDLAWAEEMMVNFKRAYKASIGVEAPRIPKAKWSLKLALLAELAGEPSKDHYQDFIKYTRSRREANLIRAKLIREGGVSWKEIEEEKSALLYSPELLAELVLEAYARRPYKEKADEYLKYRKVRRTAHGSAVHRHLLSIGVQKASKKLTRHKLRNQSQYLLNKTMADRMALLDSLESDVNKAISQSDWPLLAIGFQTLQKEYKRFINDIKGAPAPANLRGKERQAYFQELKKSLIPFQTKQAQYEKKAKEFWADGNSIQTYTTLLSTATSNVKRFLRKEAQLLASTSTSSKTRRRINEAINSSGSSRIAIASISQAWKNVKQDPFDIGALEDLKDLETRRGSDAVISYIDLRIQAIKGGS